MGAAEAAVRAVTARPAGELPDAVVVEELVVLRRVADLAEAAFLNRLRVFDARNLGESDGLGSRAWLADRAHVAPGEASRMLKLARGLDGLPETSTALSDGSIRVPHAAAMVDAVTLLGTEVVAEAEAMLVDAARAEELSRLRAALRGYGAAIDHPRAVKDAERKDKGRWLDLATTLDGVVSVSGILGPEDGPWSKRPSRP